MNAWAIVAISFPHLFTAFERRAARKDDQGQLGRTRGRRSPAPCACVRANPARRTNVPSRPQHAPTGSSFGRSRRDQQKGLRRSNRHARRQTRAGTEERRFLVPSANTRSAGSASSSIRIDTPSMAGRRALSAGRGGGAMTLAPELAEQLFRMEEARRQTQRQLDMIDRQITRRMTALIPATASAPDHVSARQVTRPWRIPRTVSCQSGCDHGGTPAGDRRLVPQAGTAGKHYHGIAGAARPGRTVCVTRMSFSPRYDIHSWR
jgi:hypothetical protein